MGANRAILVQSEVAVEPLTAAQAFLAVAKTENPDLIFLGKQAIDDDANQTGQMLAAIWERPQATYASKVEISDGKAAVTRSRTTVKYGQNAAPHNSHKTDGIENSPRRSIASGCR
jgi:electron transfer flavoprotein alpha/beta subunit